jgi:hypothetical protein
MAFLLDFGGPARRKEEEVEEEVEMRWWYKRKSGWIIRLP